MKSYLKSLLLVVGSVFVIGLLTGCTTKLQMDKQVGEAKFDFNKDLKKEVQTRHVIAIVDSGIKVSKSSNHIKDNYTDKLRKALSISVSEIISAKGFKLKGPYRTFDDITYRDKKMTYLAFVPNLDIEIKADNIHRQKHKLFYHESGDIILSGELVISIDEPMTGQTFIKKRVDLSDLNIKEPYIYERQTSYGDGSLIGKAVDSIGSDRILIDNTDLAVSKAINKFYQVAMSKIETYLDREEFLSYEEDILKLKGLKRF